MGKHDEFADYQANWQGMFGEGMSSIDDGLCNFDRVSHAVTKLGLANEFQCRRCGAPIRLIVEWPEIIALRCNISPHVAYQNHPRFGSFAQNRWRKADPRCGNYWVPEGLRCKCGEPAHVLISSSECQGHLVKRRAMGPIPFEKEMGNAAFTKAKQLRLI